MVDARELLGQLMQAGMTRSTPDRIGSAFGAGRSGASGNPLSDLLGGLGQGGGSRRPPEAIAQAHLGRRTGQAKRDWHARPQEAAGARRRSGG